MLKHVTVLKILGNPFLNIRVPELKHVTVLLLLRSLSARTRIPELKQGTNLRKLIIVSVWIYDKTNGSMFET